MVTHLAIEVRVFCSFVDPGQNGGGRLTGNAKPTPHNVLGICPVVCLFQVFAVSVDIFGRWTIFSFSGRRPTMYKASWSGRLLGSSSEK